jgi:nitrous oxidase accessory protein NosD
MNRQKTVKKKRIIIFYLICFGLICGATTAYALARPALNTLEKPEIEYKPSLLTNQAPQNSSSTILPTEGLESYGTLRPVEPISPTISKDPNCVTPYTYMHITEDTTFCPGDYAYAGSEGYSFIYISASDIILDCNGARLYSPPSYTDVRGINTHDFNPPQDGYDNVTIINCTLDSFYIGMYTSNNENLTAENNIFNGGMDIGFYAKDSNISNFKFNTFEGVWDNYSYYTHFLNVSNSIISDNQKLQGSDTHGMATIFLDGSVGNHIYDNLLFGNAGIRLTRNSEDNQVYVNQLGDIPDTALEKVAISVDRASNYNLIMDNIITNNPSGFGIGLFGHDDSDEISYGGVYLNDIFQNEITNVQVGIYANHDVNRNNIFKNTFSNITYNAFLMEPHYVNSDSMWYYPHLNTFENNTVTNAFRDVVFTNGVHDNVIKNNTFENSQDAAILFYHYPSPLNKIQNNTFENNQILNPQNVGIKFEVNAADNNTFTSNQIINAVDRGLYILSGNTNNTFLDNHFINNSTQAYDNGTGSSFDNGEKGNYWNDFKNPADGCTDTDFNGICDGAYTNISGVAGSIDNYPISGVPLLETINPIVIDETGWAIITVNATDPNGDELGYIVDNANFGRFWCWPGTINFAWHTNEYSGGNYTVNVTVDDGEHEVQQPVNVTVRNTCKLNKWGQMVCQTHPYSPNCY